MYYSKSTSITSKIRQCRYLIALILLLLSTVATADPTGNFRYPSSGHSFNGNLLFSVRVDDPDGLGRVVIRFNNSSASELLVCNCGDDTSESFTDAGIKPRDLNLGIGTHTAQLIANNGGERVVDTLRFSWNPPEIGGVEVDRTFGSFTINWSPLPGYSVYNLYIASEPNISPDNIDGLPDSVTFRSMRGTSQTIADIDDELGLFGLVTGTDTSGESAFSQVFRIEALDNQDPVVESESFTLNEDGSVSGNVLANDNDPESQPLEAELVNQPLNGAVELGANGSFTYRPNDNFNGSDEFSYTANDPQGGSQVGVVTLTVTPVNDAPLAANDSYQTNEDETLSIDVPSGVLANDSDIDGDALSASILTEPVEGTLSLNSDGSFNYEPAAEFFGADSFTYQVSDGNGGIAEAQVDIDIVGVNDLPVANNDAYQTNEDEVLVINDVTAGLLANDSDADFDEQEKFTQLRVSLLAQPDSGELALSENGTFTYTPAQNFFGSVNFSYQVADPEGETATANVTINVIDAEDLPVAADDAFTIEEDVQLVVSAADGVLANDLDGGGTTLTASVLSEPQSGTLSLSPDGGFSYLGSENFNGTDSFTYLATNEAGLTAEANVTIAITPVNDAPVAVDDMFIIDENSVAEITPLENDTDVDGDELRIVSASAESGTLTFTDTSISYTAPDSPGSDVITYTIADAEDLQATASITIAINDIDQAPVAVDDSASTEEDTPVSLTPMDNDSDPDGDELTLSADTASNGTISVEGDILTFTPDEDFNGIATASYFISDPAGNMATANINIEVLPVNDAPVAVDDEATVDELQSITIDPRINDTDVDGDELSITEAQSETGELSFSDAEITFVAPAEPGIAVISYTVSDPEGATASASIQVTINDIDSAPVTKDDEASVDEDGSVTISPLDNDTDPDGDLLTVSVVSATNGEASADSETSITFAPTENYNGEATISYLAVDPGGNETPGTINIIVNPINDAPVAEDDEITVDENSVTDINPLTNDTDVDEGDTLTITAASATLGSLTFSDNSITYTAPDNVSEDSISYTISDAEGETASATINVVVNFVEQLPVANDDTARTDEDTAVTISPLDNDVEGDGGSLTLSIDDVSSGSASVNGSVINYTPETNFNGSATINYSVTDQASNSSSATITITVVSVNDPPVAATDSATVEEGSSVTISPLDNDSDVDGDNLRITAATAANGSVQVDDSAFTLTYSAPAGFSGEDTVTYTITDSVASSTGTVNVTVSDVNNAPVAVNDSYSVNAGETETLSVLDNDTDLDNDTLTISEASATQGSVIISTDASSLSYTAPADVSTTDTVTYTITDPSGETSSATATITVTEQTFSGDFDSDGDGNSDVSASSDGTDYTVTFGDSVDAVYYEDNGEFVSVSTNDDGTYELVIEGTATANKVASLFNVSLVSDATVKRDFTLPSSTNTVYYTIAGVEYSFTVSNLDQPNANVAFGPPDKLEEDFKAKTSHDFYTRFQSFTGPLRFGVDNGEHYILQSDGTGSVRGSDFDFDVTWQEVDGNIRVDYVGNPENLRTFSVYELDDDASDGKALGIITKAEADAHIAANGKEFISVYTREGREIIRLVNDNRVFVEAESARFSNYRIDPNTYPEITSAQNGVLAPQADEQVAFQLWNIDSLKVQPIAFNDLQNGIATDIPGTNNNVFDGFVADVCSFSLATNSNSTGSGSCMFSSQSFNWSINTGNVLRLDFGNNVIADYRWLDALSVENTFSIELTTGTGAAQSKYSTHVYWLPVENVSDSSISSMVSDSYFSSALTRTNPGARGSDKSINDSNVSGFFFAANGQAKNLTGGTEFNVPVIIDTDRKWNLSGGLITLQSLSSISSGGIFSYQYDLCSNSNDANCFVWQFRELYPIAIDGNKIWVWETAFQNKTGATFNNSIDYGESVTPRIQFYELTTPVPGAPNSISFNQEPIAQDISLQTDVGIPLNNVDLRSFMSDPEADTLSIQQVAVENGSGTVVLNQDQSISFTPASNFTGDTKLFIEVSDGINRIFPVGKINVRSANVAPVANNDSATAISGFETLISPLSNDSDANNDSLTITTVNQSTGVASISNGTQIKFTPPNAFSGSATINYTIDDGRGGTASATVTVTVSKPVFSGAYDLNNSSVPDFTITNKGGTFEVSFSSEVDAVYYTLNGQRLLLGKNASGGYDFDYPPNTSPIPVLTYVINGVEYSFAPDDLSKTTPDLVYNGFTTLTNDFGTLSSYKLISRTKNHNAALNTAFENGLVYDLKTDGTGTFNTSQFSAPVNWTQSGNKVTVNFTTPLPGAAVFSVYDLDDEVNNDEAYGLITKAQADNYVAATKTELTLVNVTTFGYELIATQKQGYYYEVTRNFIQQFSIFGFQNPFIGDAGPVNVTLRDTPQELLNTAEFNFAPLTSVDILGTVHVPVPIIDSSDIVTGFASDTCTLIETSSGSNDGTGSCVFSGDSFTWSLEADGSVKVDFGLLNTTSQVNAIYRWLNTGDVENTFFVEVNDASNTNKSTIDFWFKDQSFGTSQISSVVTQATYMEIDEVITNPLNYALPGFNVVTSGNGYYFGGNGLAKNIYQTNTTLQGSTPFTTDLDLHWSIDGNGTLSLAGHSNLASGDTYRYSYSQCIDSNDQNCHAWEVRTLTPLAVDNNRLWVMETVTQDPDLGTWIGVLGRVPVGNPTIRFYEISTNIPDHPNSISFNQEPQVINTSNFSIKAGAPSTLNVLSLVGDPENDTLSVTSASADGDIVLNNDNTVTFTPRSTLVGLTQPSIGVSDGTNNVILSIDVTVLPANQTPVLTNDNRNVIGSHSYSFDVLQNDFDPDGDTLTITALDNSSIGFSIGSGGTSIEYQAPATAPTTSTVAYTVSDNFGGTATALLTVSWAANSDPVAVTDAAGPVTTGTSITISPLANDTDADGDTITISKVNSTVGPAVISNDSLSFQLTPNVAAGNYTFTYEITDGFGGNASGNIDLTVTNTNTPPVANNDTFVASRTLLNFISPLTNDTDADNDNLSITSASSTNGGTALISNGNQSINYNAPTIGNNDTINYSISDGNGGVANASISITINDNPIANPDTGTVAAGNTVTLTPLANDSDANSDSLTISTASSNDGTVTVAANKLSLDFTPSITSGNAIVNYTADDGNGGAASSTITVTVTSANSPPVANNDSITITPLGFINIDVLANDTDPDGDPLTMVSASANNGSANLSGDNLSVDYNAPSTDRSDTINYTMQDINGAQASAQVNVVVNTNPVASPSNVTISTSSMATYTPSATDADGDTLTVSAATVSSGLGSVVFSGGDVTFTSTASEGTSVISYTVADGFGGTSSNTITVTVNASPSVTGETYTFVSNSTTAVVIDAAGGVLANDSDPNSETLLVSVLSAPGHSNAFTLNPDGSFSYTHDGSNILTDGFSYNVTDGSHTVNGYASINLVKENFKPEFCTTPPTYFRAGETYSVALGVNDKDGDSQTIAVAANQTLPSFIALTGNTLTINPSFSDVGSTNTVNLTTTDGIDSDTLSFDVVVYDAFSQNNFNEFDLGGAVETIEDVAIDNYGNIIVVGQADGDLAVAKLLPSGSLDPAFNSGNPVTVDFGGSDDTAKAVKITSENKIIVGGQTNSSESGAGVDRDFVLVVLEQNGGFDNNFNTNGKIEIDIADGEDILADIQVTDNNEYLLIGQSYGSTYFTMTAVKYNDTGSLVSGFGSSGILTIDYGNHTLPRSSIIDNEGYIYVVGDTTSSSDDIFILRLDESGHDTTFATATSGVFRHDDGGAEEANDLAFDKEGNIVVAGKKDSIVAVWAFALSGTSSETASKVSSFNNNTGIYSLDFPSTTTDEAYSLVSDKRGNFYVAAKADAGTRVIKLSADGKIDTTYHGIGFKTVSLNSGINNTITRAVLDAYGQLLIVDVEDPSTTDDQVQITYDFITHTPTFGTCESAQEYVSTTSGKTTDYGNHADLASDGKGVFVVGTSTSLVDGAADLTVLKTDISGNIDSSWGNNGSKRISELTELISLFSQEVIATNNGELVIAATESDETGIILVKLDSNGDLNTNFNSSGIRDISSTAEIQVRGTGHDAATDDFYVVGETVGGSTQIYRFNSDGTDDLTFGMGVSTSSLDSGKNYTEITDSNFESHDMAVDSSGNIYIAGAFFDGTKKRLAHVIMDQSGFINYSGSWLITENETTERVGISIAASNNELFILARDASNVAYVYNYSFAGALDTTFNGTGKLTLTGYTAITTSQFQIAIDSAQRPWLSVEDGSNNAFILALNATDANFSNTFVNGGKAPLYNGISAWGTNIGFRGFLLDGSDNALLYGYDNNPTDFDVALAGMSGSGKLNSSVNHTYFDFGEGERAFAMVLDEYSSPIVAGQSYNRTNNDQDYALTRFDNSGNSQANFATSGAGALQSNSIGVQDANTLLTLGGPSDDGYSDIQIATSGHLFMAGDTTPTSNANNKDMTVLGTEPGSADLNDTLGYNIANVDISGTASNDKVSDSYLADDGSLYVVGTASTKAFIAKILKGGGLDSTFGSSGVTEFTAGSQTHFNAITSDGQGRLIAVGFVENSSFDGLIVRFNTDGSLDTTFSSGDGTNGYDAFDGTNCEEDYFSVDVGADGTIYVGGQESSNALIVAYNSDGTLHTGFNSGGFMSLDYGSTVDFDEGFDDIKVDQFGGIMALAVISSTNQFTLSRFKPDGTKLRDYSGLHSPGTITQMHALEIDTLGNVFVTGEIQHDQIWKFYVVRFPNAVGPLL